MSVDPIRAVTEMYFTLVFRGDIRKFAGNPHKTDTPFGRPVVVGVGNAFDAFDELERLRESEIAPALTPSIEE